MKNHKRKSPSRDVMFNVAGFVCICTVETNGKCELFASSTSLALFLFHERDYSRVFDMMEKSYYSAVYIGRVDTPSGADIRFQKYICL